MSQSVIKQTSLIERITQDALNNQPVSAAQVVELGQMMNKNNQLALQRHTAQQATIKDLTERIYKLEQKLLAEKAINEPKNEWDLIAVGFMGGCAILSKPATSHNEQDIDDQGGEHFQ